MQLPIDFTRSTRLLMGEDRYNRFFEALHEESPVSVRINPLKCYYMPRNGERVPWCNTGYYLPDRPQFTFDPLLHAGLYYVQEASSMFVAHVLQSFVNREDGPIRCLDLCAAPGGKSTTLRTVLPSGSLLVSNEPVAKRAQVLVENIQKFGHRDCVVTSNYPRDFRAAGCQFDVILADVPCSGEGMFRRDPEAINEWSRQKVEACQQLQREILSDIWPCLRPGGLFIYSTCTYNTLENEENVHWITEHFDAELLSIPISDHWGITGSLLHGFYGPVCRFIPGFTRGEGLFMAALRKGGDDLVQGSRNKVQGEKSPFGVDASLHILHQGTPEFTQKGKTQIPTQALALSAALDKNRFPMAPLTWQEAISYLRGESLTLHPSVPRGFIIVTYKDIPLGFVKNIGTRANNLYPDGWRIRSTHLPEEPPRILDV